MVGYSEGTLQILPKAQVANKKMIKISIFRTRSILYPLKRYYFQRSKELAYQEVKNHRRNPSRSILLDFIKKRIQLQDIRAKNGNTSGILHENGDF
jgi:hypothetical protein